VKTIRLIAATGALLVARGVAAAPTGGIDTAPADSPLRAPLALATCSFAGAPADARCGTSTVPEDRTRPAGRSLPIHVMVLPATAPERRAAEPVVYLAGGPGEAASDAALDLPAILAALRPEHDLVFVDFRGTGRSRPLACPKPADDAPSPMRLDATRVRECRDALADTADLRQYTTESYVADLVAALDALGARRIEVVAASYGTIVAQVLLREHPGRVHTTTLVGATPALPEPLLFDGRDAARALAATLTDCAADEACAKDNPGIEGDLERALARLPVTAEVVDPETKETRSVRLDRALFLDTLRTRLYSVEAASRIPRGLHHAAAGDFSEMARVALVIARHRDEGFSLPVFLSVMCTESISAIDPRAAETWGTVAPFGADRLLSWIEACKWWPHETQTPATTVRDGFFPALLLSGAFDPVTPPYWGEQVSLAWPGSRLVVFAASSHSPDNECAASLVRAFVAAGDPRKLDVSCAASERRPPFAR
jgi:pimeloyl-ACP methyl ester carboxylesterase